MSLLERVFKRKSYRIIFLATALLVMVACGVAVAYFFIRSPSQAISQESIPESSLTAADFLLSEENLKHTEPKYYLFREQRKSWDSEMIMRYWYPISEILTDIISKRNDQEMERIFNK